MATIKEIEGIGDVYGAKLREVGVKTVEALLERGATPKGRKELAAETGFAEQTILEWVNRADMFRVPGIGSQYSDLLEAAGVDTVRELAKRKAENLFETLKKVNEEKNKVNKLPSVSQIQNWIDAAKELPRGVSY